jgi:hypothetical protein
MMCYFVIYAKTAETSSTGVFELDMQSELLYPFEGMGVDTSWYFELPPAGNPFDYDTLFEVMVSIDYTALNSYELRERVVKQLPREAGGDRAFSVRRDLPDTWYELANDSVSPAKIALTISKSDFPPHLQDITIRELAVTVRRKDGGAYDFKVKPCLNANIRRHGSASGHSHQALHACGVHPIRPAGRLAGLEAMRICSVVSPRLTRNPTRMADTGLTSSVAPTIRGRQR